MASKVPSISIDGDWETLEIIAYEVDNMVHRYAKSWLSAEMITASTYRDGYIWAIDESLIRLVIL